MGVPHRLCPSRARSTIVVAGALLLLAASPASAAIRIWSGGGGNSNWTTAGNWVSGQVPADGDVVIISSSATSGLGTNNIVDLDLAGITFDHAYSLFGNEITIGTGGISVTAGPTDSIQISAPLRLADNQTWKTTASDVFVNSSVTLDAHTLTFEVVNGAEIDVNGAIVGSGRVVKIGPGILHLDGASSYTGRTVIQEGYVVVGSPTGLGAGGSLVNGTEVSEEGAAAGTLTLDNVAIATEWIRLSGEGQSGNSALQAKGNSTIGGPVTVLTDIGINVIFPAQLTFLDAISGPGRISLVHDGTWVFSHYNIYTGGLGIGEGGDPHSRVLLTEDEAIPFAPLQHLPAGSLLTLDSGVVQTFTGLTGAGNIRLTDDSSWVYLNGGIESTFSGAIGGSGLVGMIGTGHQIFTGSFASFSGQVIVGSGRVTLVNSTTSGSVSADTDGTLALQGTTAVAWIIGSGGTVRLQAQGDAAAVATAANLLMSATGTLVVDTTSTGGMGRLDVAGLVALNGSTLQVPIAPGFTAAPGTVFTLITNGSSDPVHETFAGLPEGAIFTSGLARFTISYVGGNGNDVTLTLIGIARNYLLSEGATGGFFITDILIANPNDTPAPIRVSFLKPGGGTVEFDDEVPAMRRKTITANGVAALDATEFSTVVRSLNGLPLAVERTMTWDQQVGYGSHTERATETPSTTWYFAEGSQGFFSTFLLLANPNTTSSVATVEYLLEGEPKVTRTYDVPAQSRRTIDAGADPALVDRSFGMVVTFTQPGLAERAMYFGTNPLWRGGHASAGVVAPATEAFVAEGATGPFFETYILIANPNPADVTATLTFGRQGDTPIVLQRTIVASSRLTLNIESLDPGLANVAVSTTVSATAPVIVERAQYWPDPAPQWYEAHSSPALQTTGTKWGLAEGRVGGPSNYQTYILLANTNAAKDAHVSITFLRESGPPVAKTFTVPATQRLNVPVGPGTDVPEVFSENFGALITSDVPIVVERAMYADAAGQVWAAGTSANATKLP